MCSTTVLRISKNPEGALDIEVRGEKTTSLLAQVLISREAFDCFFEKFSGQIVLKGPFEKIKSENLEKIVSIFTQYIESCKVPRGEVLHIPLPPYLSMPENVSKFLSTVQPRSSAIQKLLDRLWDFLTEEEISSLCKLNSHPQFLEFWRSLIQYRKNLEEYLAAYGDPYGFVRPNPLKMQLIEVQRETELSIRFEQNLLLFSNKDSIFV